MSETKQVLYQELTRLENEVDSLDMKRFDLKDQIIKIKNELNQLGETI